MSAGGSFLIFLSILIAGYFFSGPGWFSLDTVLRRRKEPSEA